MIESALTRCNRRHIKFMNSRIAPTSVAAGEEVEVVAGGGEEETKARDEVISMFEKCLSISDEVGEDDAQKRQIGKHRESRHPLRLTCKQLADAHLRTQEVLDAEQRKRERERGEREEILVESRGKRDRLDVGRMYDRHIHPLSPPTQRLSLGKACFRKNFSLQDECFFGRRGGVRGPFRYACDETGPSCRRCKAQRKRKRADGFAASSDDCSRFAILAKS